MAHMQKFMQKSKFEKIEKIQKMQCVCLMGAHHVLDFFVIKHLVLGYLCAKG